MRDFDAFVLVFLGVALFSGYMFLKSMAGQRSLIRSQGYSGSKEFSVLRNSGMLSTGLWLMLLLGSIGATTVNFAISYYDHKGFEAHEALAPIFPGAKPIKILPMIDSKGRMTSQPVGIYEAEAAPEAILAYYRNSALDGGWKYEEVIKDRLIILFKDDGAEMKIVVQRKSSPGTPPVCQLTFVINE